VRDSIEYKKEETEKLRDQLTGLPNRQHLERFVASELATAGFPCSILLLNLKQAVGAKIPSRISIQNLVARIAEAARSSLRGADLLFRYDTDRFVALLTQTDAGTADAVGRRIASELANVHLSDEDSPSVSGVKIGRATAPDDGATLSDLLMVAENRPLPPPPSAIRQSIH